MELAKMDRFGPLQIGSESNMALNPLDSPLGVIGGALGC